MKMKNYNVFVDKLHLEFNNFLSSPKITWENKAMKYVDGLAAEELRRLVSIETRREYGAFFTDSELAKKVLQLLKPTFTRDSYIYDSACGAGNLLIAAADYFRKCDIQFDNKTHFLGTDLHQEFIEAAKIRFQINNLLKQPNIDLKKSNKVFNAKYDLISSNGLEKNHFYEKDWARGKVSAAALFIDRIIKFSNPGVSIIAILPDVLRSGTRYEKWRDMVNKECIIEKIELLGQFDKFADVDVYALLMTKRQVPDVTNSINKKAILKTTVDQKKSIEDIFDICVGTVVDNRDPKKGVSNSYIVSKGLKGWTSQNDASLTRKHQGKSFKKPFVVIKRTSRMGDSQRAIATIINIPKPVFVDNHLIILKPKSGTLKDCKKILISLKDKRTDIWLNEKIRCRHLTVKVVSKIPIWD
jgi:SAM-dependent methyltransferase